MKRKYVTVASVGLGVLFLCAPAPLTYAQTFSAAPFVMDHAVEPRDIFTDTLVIKNTGSQPVTIYPTVHNVSVGTTGGIETFVSPSMSDRTTSLATWIELSRLASTLAPGESKELPVTFRIHQDAPAGEYHAFIGFASGRTRDDAEAVVMRGGAPGTVVNITVKDTSASLLRLSKFLISRFITKSGEGDISYVVENTGDTVLTPVGDIIIYNRRGEEVGSVPVNQDGRTVAPGETTEFTASVSNSGLLGKYKALLSIEYGTTQKASLNDTVYFYVLPWQKILIVFGIFLLGALLFSLYVHRRYLQSDVDDDMEHLPLTLRDTLSQSHGHDLDMKQ